MQVFCIILKDYRLRMRYLFDLIRRKRDAIQKILPLFIGSEGIID